MAENKDVQGPQHLQNDGSKGEEALEGNTGAGGSGAGSETEGGETVRTDLGQDSDGNTGVMTNDEFEKDEVAGGGDSLRDEPTTVGNSSDSGN